MSDETRGTTTGPRIFVSYSHEDAEWLEALTTHLDPLGGDLDLWADTRLQAGDLWREEIEAALAAAQAAVFLVSPDFLKSHFIRDHELPALLEQAESGGLRVLCLHVRPSVMAGSTALKEVYERLRRFQALNDPNEALSEIKGAKREKALAAIAGKIHSLASQAPVRPAGPGSAGVVPVAFRNWPHGSSDGVFLGRGPELKLLDEAWADAGRTTVVTLVATGGVGKTTLVRQWLDRLRADGWRSASRVYAWSFYSQGTDENRQASDEDFLDKTLTWFGVPHANVKSAADKGRLLGETLSRERTLLILDGVEPLQYPPGPLGGRLRAPGVEALLTHVATAGAPGLIVVTTREALTNLREFERNADRPAGAVVAHDVSNLDEADGARVLHRLGVTNAGAAKIADDDEELRAASREVNGHALTLSLLGNFLAQAHDGDVQRRDRVDFTEAAEEVGRHAFRVIEAYEVWLSSDDERSRRALAVARLLGLFDRPADAACLAALRKDPPIVGLTEALVGLSATQWQLAIGRARECGLLLPGEGGTALDAHPLVREIFARRLREERPDAWREGHRRLYEHLKASAPHRPEGLAGLQPLYQAVAHGCHAGLHQQAYGEVYQDRIVRRAEFYSPNKLGAFGSDLTAVACFFDEPWSRLAPGLSEGDQAWLLNEAAFSLRALGRLTEAVQPMRAGVDAAVHLSAWRNAAQGASNVSELELTLGDVAAAVADAEQSVAHADRSGDAFLRMVGRTVLADALHQAGRRPEASERFREAEALQVERQPPYPLLYSLRGFRYCDLLLADAERAAGNGHRRGEVGEDVERRAAAALTVATAHGDLLSIALDHLTLARVALYRALLGPARATVDLAMAREHVAQAVDGLRASGEVEFIARSLLTRAWLRAVEGDAAHAKADLDEAQRIAERGSMRLHLADVHLHRARLFRDRRALAEARQLIEECGYNRRDEELRDAEEAARSWGVA